MTLMLYIARQFMLAILTVTGGLMALVMLLDTVELTRRTANKSGVNFGHVLEMSLLKAPEMMIRILPFAVMIGAMIALTRLTRRSELVVARASGVSVWQFLRPAWAVALLIGVITVSVINPIASAMLSRFEKLENRYISGQSSMLSVSESGLWLRDFSEEVAPYDDHETAAYERIFHASHLDQEATRLHNVIIFFYSEDSRFLGRIDAKSALLGKGKWLLREVVRSRIGKPPELINQMELQTNLTLEQIQDSFASPETLSFWELPGFIQLLEEAGFSALRHKLHFQVSLTLPLMLVGMIFVAATFSLRSPRRGGLTLLISGGVISGFVIYFLSDLTHAMGLSGDLPLMAAAWIPPVATLLAGIWMMLHLEHG